jgi:hypothetical protein
MINAKISLRARISLSLLRAALGTIVGGSTYERPVASPAATWMPSKHSGSLVRSIEVLSPPIPRSRIPLW